MKRTLSFLFLLLFLMTGCGIKAREFNVREMMPSFYDSEWLVNTPESYMDSSVIFKDAPSRYLSDVGMVLRENASSYRRVSRDNIIRQATGMAGIQAGYTCLPTDEGV